MLYDFVYHLKLITPLHCISEAESLKEHLHLHQHTVAMGGAIVIDSLMNRSGMAQILGRSSSGSTAAILVSKYNSLQLVRFVFRNYPNNRSALTK